LIREILEFVGLGGIILMISLVSLTKMALGAILTIVGAFYPSNVDDKTPGQANINIAKAKAAFKGSLRYGVILGGVILIMGAIVDGARDISSGLHATRSNLSKDFSELDATEMLNRIEEKCKYDPSFYICKYKASPARLPELPEGESGSLAPRGRATP
jgi:hypothetical protein